ncbi:MAG: (Fe-S)-binding protein [Planctomycetaceae bacterium]|nr:(Fe-S)-binding protein [Planctomycetaceae bacterium]
MKVALFIPCYVDQFYPKVGLATCLLLEHFGVDHCFPEQQTCCGQPMANSGCEDEARPLAERYVEIFRDYDYVVAPSGSCVSMVRNHYDHLLQTRDSAADRVRERTLELSEFLVNVLNVKSVAGSYPYTVGVHQSCHGLRELRVAPSSEVMLPRDNNLMTLLGSLDGIQFANLKRKDECCGFGGTFAVAEEDVSCMMGNDRITDHLDAGAQVVTGADMSCLMHLDGLIQRQRKPLRILHFAELLCEAMSIPVTAE